MCNLTVQPELHGEFELEDEVVRFYINKLSMHTFQNSGILERIKTGYVWLIEAGEERKINLAPLLLLVITVPAFPAPSGLCQPAAA